MTTTTRTPSTNNLPDVTEMSPDDLEIQRHLLDLALQPMDEFEGFVQIEQYLGSALRYQLNFINYALAMSQLTRTPAFRGYLTAAQANTIEKMRDKRVWAYWSHENLIGYQRWNPDPIVKHNVMYTGFFGVMLAMFETLNDDFRFSEPGALTLHWSEDTSYDYDFGTVAEAIRRNMAGSKHTLYPCEPRLIYPMCNAFAINTLPAHDRLHGTELTGELVDKMRDAWTRFKYLREDGRFISGRGPLKTFMGPAAANDAIMAFWLHPVVPDQAERSWEIVRDRLVTIREDGKVSIEKAAWEGMLDAGNYSRGDAMSRAAVMATAKEFGDQEMADRMERSLDAKYETVRQNGARRYTGMSMWANANFALARFTRPGALRELLNGDLPPAWAEGPLLAEAAYPDVLVARAVTDGGALDLVLRPGAGGGRTTLGIERLVPGSEYAVTGGVTSTVTADDEGRALVEVDLTDRLEVRVTPAG